MADCAVKIENLVKCYGEVRAVDDISFEVQRGSLFAFLGINGAGKSTTINIICSILKKDGGKVFVNGHDLDEQPFEIKRGTGIVFQTSVLDRELTVKQNLDLRTSFYSLSKAEKRENIRNIIELLELQPILNRTVKNLSGGQLRRVDIARAMVHKPRLLILDEPTTGLDPRTRQQVWSLIDKIRTEAGMTVFLTTHYLEEAERATDVVIMDKGKIIAHGTPNELKNKYSSDGLYAYMQKNLQFERTLTENGLNFLYIIDCGAYRIKVKDTADAKSLIKKLDKYLTDIELVKGNMDDVFLSVTGKDIKVMGESDEND
ncbi:MAG: ABC transporter ATP-binding protein [Clostridiales bacterium]|nr:ABC transporter ATP-binding protein [Clostridiales bacterium]